jgi:Transposase DDE domain group 1
MLRLFSHNVDFYIQKHEKAPKEIELDFDGSAVEAHGRQQFIAFNGHYEINAYLPLFVRDQYDYLLASVLRPGNVPDTAMALVVLKALVKRFRRAWPEVRILVRGDAAFHDPEIMDWCEANDVEYILGLKGDNALNVGSKQFDAEAERRFHETYGAPWFAGPNGSKEKHALLREVSAQSKVDRRAAYAILDERHVRRTGKFQHRAGEGGNDKKRLERRWKRERTAVSVARFTDRGLKRRYLVVSDGLSAYTPDHIYDEIYSLRGRAELTIRSLKALGAHRLNNQEALTNQFQLLIYQMTHNLLQMLTELLPDTLRHLSIETIIREIIRIPVQVKVSTRRTWFRLTSSYKYKDIVLSLFKRLNALPRAA